MFGIGASSPLDTLGEPLPPAERDRLLETAADAIRKRGLVTPAIWALEIHRPLSWVVGQGAIALTPLLGPLLGAETLTQISRLLSEPGNIERFIERLEAPAGLPPSDEGRGRGMGASA